MQIQELKKEIEALPESSPEEREQAAKELERYNFSPTLIVPVEGFTRMTKDDFLGELERIAAFTVSDFQEAGFPEKLTEETAEEKKETQLKMLVYHFKLLSRLRKNEPEAWDEVSELYEED